MKLLLALLFSLAASAQPTPQAPQPLLTVTAGKFTWAVKIQTPTQVTGLRCADPTTGADKLVMKPGINDSMVCTITLSQPADASGFIVTPYSVAVSDGSITPVLQPFPTLVVSGGNTTWKFTVTIP